ncbi:MAG: terminase small subunit [Gammaproteobacteria bacterium]
MGVGRPSKYRGKQTCRQVLQYLDTCVDTTELVSDKVAVRHVKLPKIEGAALYLGVSRETVNQWRNTHPEFSDVIELLVQKQVSALIDNGLGGHYSAVIAKVLLARHGYREGIEHMGEDGGPLRIDLAKALDRAYGTGG